MEERILVRDIRRRREFEDLDTADIPSVRFRDPRQLPPALGKRDVETSLAVRQPIEQELERERGLSGSRLAIQQIDVGSG